MSCSSEGQQDSDTNRTLVNGHDSSLQHHRSNNYSDNSEWQQQRSKQHSKQHSKPRPSPLTFYTHQTNNNNPPSSYLNAANNPTSNISSNDSMAPHDIVGSSQRAVDSTASATAAAATAFAFPGHHIMPEFDPSDQSSCTTSFSRSNRRAAAAVSEMNGYGRPRSYDDNDDDDAMDAEKASSQYAAEPPKKKLRSTASMLFDAAFETVIFTGAVALSAYQLLTGKAKLGGSSSNTSTSTSTSHSKNGSTSSMTASKDNEDEDVAKGATLSNVPESAPVESKQEEEQSALTRADAATTTRTLRPHYSSSSLTRAGRLNGGYGGGGYYHKARTARPFRGNSKRASLSGAYHFSGGVGGGGGGGLGGGFGAKGGYHARSASMPVRPNTGTEDTDEMFLRMEAQLTNLIAEGKRALSSRIEVWDEE
ncbi:hypothetical protein BGZ94_007038 [Podila epigama]|nr:hypothetical protein BGZ94_007038 [Podila epigama]